MKVLVQNDQTQLCLYICHLQYLELRYSKKKKTEEKNNLLSVGVLKGFVMHGIMYAFLWHFYKSRGKMFQNYVSFKHLVVNFLCESPIDANNLLLRKTKQPCWERFGCSKTRIFTTIAVQP